MPNAISRFLTTTAPSSATPRRTAAQSGTTTQTSTTANPATPGGAMGKDQFLQLLVAQMKNQDPLNPMDGTQMATQLAQFSTVEQLQNANTTLTQIADAVRVANGSTGSSKPTGA